MNEQPDQITQILDAVGAGDQKAAENLWTLVYDELRQLAAQHMAGEKAGQTLQPTALVHEAWLRLGGSREQQWKSRAHFFGAAAEAMRRILIDRARVRNRVRHGKGLSRVELDHVDLASEAPAETLLWVDDALSKLAQEDQVKADLVKLRFFVGLSIPEAGRALGLSERTANRYWTYARAWLYDELKAEE
jgi:RNA polymerase sigma factor (TIGR02999 family)